MPEQRFNSLFGRDYTAHPSPYPHYYEFQSEIAKSIPRGRAQKFNALEIGCGAGHTTGYFLRRFRNALVFAIDNEPVMIEQAKKNLRRFGGDRAVIIQADALVCASLLESGAVDVFYSGYTLHNFSPEYRVSLLKQIFRVLVPGGAFVNGDKYATDNLELRAKDFNWSVKQILRNFGSNPKLCYEWINHISQDESPERLMPAKEAIWQMKSIGFTNMRFSYKKHMESVLSAVKPD